MKALAVLPLLLGLGWPGFAKVDDFDNCPEFFLGSVQIWKNRYRHICQTYSGNVKMFATLYSTDHRIPLFSAYKYQDDLGVPRPSLVWKIEPQLVKNTYGGDMMTVTELRQHDQNLDKKDVEKSQAVNEDYDGSFYVKGHLAPVCHRASKQDKECTFTLTNAVPQHPGFNSYSWRDREVKVKEYIKKHCLPVNQQVDAYLMAGAVPGSSSIKRFATNGMVLSDSTCPRRIPKEGYEEGWLIYDSVTKTQLIVDRQEKPLSGGKLVAVARNEDGRVIHKDGRLWFWSKIWDLGQGQDFTKMSSGVNIPKYLWGAFCCRITVAGKTDWFSKAHVGDNDEDGDVTELSVAELEKKLAKDYNLQPFTIFDGKCKDLQSSIYQYQSAASAAKKQKVG
ncbi:ENDD1 protein, partial [Atractosteus spatula]|nr:ENDD1 protein [Atractosteus spatula]